MSDREPLGQRESAISRALWAGLDRATKYLDKYNPDAASGGSWSYDWCRFRRRRRCFYPREMNEEATRLSGYAVWVPYDRGICWRDVWKDQEKCPVSEPGPNSGQPGAMVDATVPWEDGGQRVPG